MSGKRRSVRPAVRVLLVSLLVLFAGACNLWDTETTSSPASPPEPGPAGFVIDTSGGTGTLGDGGTSDPEEWGVYLDNYGPGGIRILREGTADASIPSGILALESDLGTEPLVVATDMAIPVYADHPAENGVYYFLQNDSVLYHKVSDTPVAVSGIRVETGATLTLGLNLWGTAQLNLANDIEVRGTLRTAFLDVDPLDPGYLKDRGAIYLQTGGAAYVRPSGTVSAAGEPGDTGRGGNGGSIEIYTTGVFLNEGTIVASGGTTTGPGSGGNGGSFRATSANGGIYISGPVTTRGGSGTQGGGPGGSVTLHLESAFDLCNSGSIDTRGGDGTGTGDAEPADGGSGGSIYMDTYGGRLITSGNLTAGGGDSLNANAASRGGNGGSIDIESLWAVEGGGPSASILEISGNLSTKGGNGANGGDGAYVYLYYGDSSGTGGIVLRGYSEILANGGNGALWGGGSGYVSLYDNYFGDPADGIRVESDIHANGGANLMISDSNYGGNSGGTVDVWAGTGAVLVEGSIYADGGDGTKYGGNGGYVSLYSSSAAVAASGPISANGGDSATTGSGSGAYAGSGGSVTLWSGTPPSTYGSISVDAGAGGDPGSPAGDGTVTIDSGGVS